MITFYITKGDILYLADFRTHRVHYHYTRQININPVRFLHNIYTTGPSASYPSFLEISVPTLRAGRDSPLGPVYRLVIPYLSPVITNTQSPHRSALIMTYNYFKGPYVYTLSSWSILQLVFSLCNAHISISIVTYEQSVSHISLTCSLSKRPNSTEVPNDASARRQHSHFPPLQHASPWRPKWHV